MKPVVRRSRFARRQKRGWVRTSARPPRLRVSQRPDTAGGASRLSAPRGGRLGVAVNRVRKLNDADRRARDRLILEARSQGRSWSEIAARFSLSESSARRGAANAARLRAESTISCSRTASRWSAAAEWRCVSSSPVDDLPAPPCSGSPAARRSSRCTLGTACPDGRDGSQVFPPVVFRDRFCGKAPMPVGRPAIRLGGR